MECLLKSSGFHRDFSDSDRVPFRHVYVASTDYTFGRTEYEVHWPTTKWNVELGPQNYNLWVTGVSYRF
jgi:hypothetical protein